MFTWSGPAITAKIFLPLILSFTAGLIVVPVRDIWTAGWFVLVVLPLVGVAAWLFSNIGEIRSSSNGVLYRKWRKWHEIPASEISDVVRVFPCFAALVLNEHVRLFFFPDPDTRRLIRSLPAAALQSRDATPQTAVVAAAPQKHKLSPRGFFSFLIGVVLGVAISQARSSARNYDMKSGAALLLENRYIPLFVGVSVLFLSALVVARRLKENQLDISLAIIGLGIVYLSSTIFRLL